MGVDQRLQHAPRLIALFVALRDRGQREGGRRMNELPLACEGDELGSPLSRVRIERAARGGKRFELGYEALVAIVLLAPVDRSRRQRSAEQTSGQKPIQRSHLVVRLLGVGERTELLIETL